MVPLHTLILPDSGPGRFGLMRSCRLLRFVPGSCAFDSSTDFGQLRCTTALFYLFLARYALCPALLTIAIRSARTRGLPYGRTMYRCGNGQRL